MTSPTVIPRGATSINTEVRHFEFAGAPVNGTSGTYAGIAEAGALLVDTTTGITYANTNTQASPTWTRQSAIAAGSVSLPILAATTSGTVTVTDARVSATSIIDGLTAVNNNADATGIVIAWVNAVSAGSFVIGYRNLAAGAMAQVWTARFRIES